MAQLGGNFDATAVAPKTDFEIIPPGDYPVMIVNSEMKPTKDGTGQYLWLELDVIDGEFAGRKLWDRLNLVNKNAKAAEIAERTLSAICHAVGVMNVSDSEQLHGKAMLAKVKVKPAEGNYQAANEISTYAAMPGYAPAAKPAFRPAVAQAQAAQVAAPAASAPAAQASGGATPPPWRKR